TGTAQARPDVVGFSGDYSPGTIVVKTNERRLYLVVDQGRAVRYPVGVGRAGKQWAGTTRIAAQPDGSRRDDPGRRRIRDPRHQRAGFGRRFRLLWLHSHAEFRYHRSL